MVISFLQKTERLNLLYLVPVISKRPLTVTLHRFYRFREPEMNLFSGAATAIVRSGNESGDLIFTAKGRRS